MTTDRFTFYSQNYREIMNLAELQKEVAEKFPLEIGNLLEELFKDALTSGVFEHRDWYWENDPSEDNFAFQERRFEGHGPYYAIHPLKKSVALLHGGEKKQDVADLMQCGLWFSSRERRRKTDMPFEELDAALKSRKRDFEAAGIAVKQESDGWFAYVPVGDLLHISVFANRKKNLKAVLERVQKLLAATQPIIDGLTTTKPQKTKRRRRA